MGETERLLLLVACAVAAAMLVEAQSSADQWQLYQKRGIDSCTAVGYDECDACTTRGVRGNETRFYTCAFSGSEVDCYSSASNQCADPDLLIQTRLAGCAGLRMCQVGAKRTAVYLFEVESSEGVAVVAGEDSEFWMQLNDTYVVGYGSADSVTVASHDGAVTFMALDDDGSYTTSSGVCELGVWCEAAGSIEYRMAEVSIEEVQSPPPPPFIVSLEKNDDYGVQVVGGENNLIEIDSGRTNVDEDTLSRLVMTFEGLTVYAMGLDLNGPSLLFTIEADDGDPFADELDCTWKSGWPHGYYSSIAWYYSFGFSGQVIHCNFDSLFSSGNYDEFDYEGYQGSFANDPLFPTFSSRAAAFVTQHFLSWF